MAMPASEPSSSPKYEQQVKMKASLSEALAAYCQENMCFVDFVHITGRVSFNLDNRETIHLMVSHMAMPQPFTDMPAPGTKPPPKPPRRKKPPAVVSSKASPTKVSPTKASPTKATVTKGKKERPKSGPKQTAMPPALPHTPGRGRQAAVKARIMMTKIAQKEGRAQEVEDFEQNSEEDQVESAAAAAYPDSADIEMDNHVDALPGQLAEDNERLVMDVTSTPVKLEAPADERSPGAEAESPNNAISLEASGPNTLEPVSKRPKNGDGDAGGDADYKPDGDDGPEEMEMESDDDHSLNDTENARPSASPAAMTYACAVCSKSFPSKKKLSSHASRHKKVFSCPQSECAPKVFQSRGEIRKHFREVHHRNRKELLPCAVCRQEFLENDQLERHNSQEHNHICSVCGESFLRPTGLARHSTQTHPHPTSLRCSACQRGFVSKGAYRKHMKRHEDKARGKLMCDECGKEFTAQSTLYHHKKAFHQGIQPYKCDLCGKAFNFNVSLKLHMLKHQGLRPYKCDVCGKTYLTASHLKYHVRAVHSSEKQFACPVCDKRFPYENSLKLHVKLHTGDRPFECLICRKTFVAKSALKAHESSHVEGKDFACDMCGKCYKTEHLLRTHRRRHTADGSRYMCDICGNTFMYKSNLEVHYAIHGDTRKFRCDVCDKTFKTYPTLYSHRFVHSSHNPYNCPVCDKSFKTKERMKAHEKRHSGLKPFTCDQCGSSFPDKGGLSKHRKTVHASVPRYACPVCGKRCNRADNLRVHMKVHRDPDLLKLSRDELVVAPGGAAVDMETDGFPLGIMPGGSLLGRAQRPAAGEQVDEDGAAGAGYPDEHGDGMSDPAGGEFLAQDGHPPVGFHPAADGAVAHGGGPTLAEALRYGLPPRGPDHQQHQHHHQHHHEQHHHEHLHLQQHQQQQQQQQQQLHLATSNAAARGIVGAVEDGVVASNSGGDLGHPTPPPGGDGVEVLSVAGVTSHSLAAQVAGVSQWGATGTGALAYPAFLMASHPAVFAAPMTQGHGIPSGCDPHNPTPDQSQYAHNENSY